MMMCTIGLGKKLRGFCHLHLIIAALETVQLGTVTYGTKASFYKQGSKQGNQVCMRASSRQSVDLARGTVNGCTRQKKTSVYKMLDVSFDLPIQSNNLSALLKQHIEFKESY